MKVGASGGGGGWNPGIYCLFILMYARTLLYLIDIVL